MNQKLPDIAKNVCEIVERVVSEYSGRLLETAMRKDRGEISNQRHSDNFLSEIDVELHERYRVEFAKLFPGCIYASEEGDATILGAGPSSSPEYIVLVDPLDTSELAVRGLCGYTHVAVYSIAKGKPVVAVVGDMFHEVRLYCGTHLAENDEIAFVRTKSGNSFEIGCGSTVSVNRSILTTYLMRPKERFRVIAQEEQLLAELSSANADGKRSGRIGVDFGSIGLCHVATGGTDAFIEVAKGFWPWDLYPGQCILRAAGGTVIDLKGNEISLELPNTVDGMKLVMNERRKFIAASSNTLAQAVLSKLSVSNI